MRTILEYVRGKGVEALVLLYGVGPPSPRDVPCVVQGLRAKRGDDGI